MGKLRVLKCIFIGHGVCTMHGRSIGCSRHFPLIEVQQRIFSRNAKWWPTIVVSVKNKINLFAFHASLIGVSEECRSCQGLILHCTYYKYVVLR